MGRMSSDSILGGGGELSSFWEVKRGSQNFYLAYVMMDEMNDPRKNRISFRVVQTRDCDGPMMAPDVYAGQRTVA